MVITGRCFKPAYGIWWKNLDIDALPIAKGLWEQTHQKSAAVDHINKMNIDNDQKLKATDDYSRSPPSPGNGAPAPAQTHRDSLTIGGAHRAYCIKPVMRSPGGRVSILTHARSPKDCGSRATHARRLD